MSNETPGTQISTVQWISDSSAEPFDKSILVNSLNNSITLYIAHTEWFLKHRDAGFRNLGIILTLEVAFYAWISDHYETKLTVSAISLAFCILSFLFARLSINSCMRSQRAANEYVVTMNKLVWALGLSTSISVDEHLKRIIQEYRVFKNDKHLWVPRNMGQNNPEIRDSETTEEFVNQYLNKKNTTLFHAKRIMLACFVASGVLPAIWLIKLLASL